jgi:hypothetical protein
MNMTNPARDVPGMQANLWTLPSASRFNAATDLLFRTMISCGFSASADG